MMSFNGQGRIEINSIGKISKMFRKGYKNKWENLDRRLLRVYAIGESQEGLDKVRTGSDEPLFLQTQALTIEKSCGHINHLLVPQYKMLGTCLGNFQQSVHQSRFNEQDTRHCVQCYDETVSNFSLHLAILNF